MKISCSTLKLSEAATNVQRAVSAKTSIPALEGILLNAEGEIVSLYGYDLEIGITTTIDARVTEPGSIVLNARLFCDILRKLPTDTVEISVDEKFLVTIKSGESTFSLIGISGQEYPEMPNVGDKTPIVLPQNLLKNMIRQTIFSVATGGSKPVHTGIRFEIGNGMIQLIAVDGFRLAVRKEPIANVEEESVFVVPAKTLSEVSKLLLDDDIDLSIGIGNRHIIFEINSYSVISRLLDHNEFMDYQAAIPKTCVTSVRVNTRQFIESLERISLLISEKILNPVKCIFDDNTIRSTCATTLGSGQDQIAAIIQGDRVEIGFRSKFLLEALHAIDSDEVLVELNGALSPIKIVPIDGDRFLYMVLPVRLK